MKKSTNQQSCSAPEGFSYGNADNREDCFFDAVAQCLNQIESVKNKHGKIDTRKLRIQCFEYVKNNTSTLRLFKSADSQDEAQMQTKQRLFSTN